MYELEGQLGDVKSFIYIILFIKFKTTFEDIFL